MKWSRKWDLERSTSLEIPATAKRRTLNVCLVHTITTPNLQGPVESEMVWQGFLLCLAPSLQTCIYIRRLQICQQSSQIVPVFFLWPFLLCEVGNGSEWGPITHSGLLFSSVSIRPWNMFPTQQLIARHWASILLWPRIRLSSTHVAADRWSMASTVSCFISTNCSSQGQSLCYWKHFIVCISLTL